MKKVKFIADFANKIAGEVVEVQPQLASTLVNHDKVAEYTNEDVTTPRVDAVHVEPTTEVEQTEVEQTEVVDTENVSEEVKATSKKK